VNRKIASIELELFVQVDLIIRDGTVVSHRGVEQANIAVRDGIIVAIGNFEGLRSKEVLDAKGLHILPGVIDTEIHHTVQYVNETRAAVKGGITTAFFLNENENNDIDHAYCDYAYLQQATKDNIADLVSLEKRVGCVGLHLSMSKANGCNGIYDDRALLEVLKNGNRRVIIHAEDQFKLDQQEHLIERTNVASHLTWRDESVSIEATRRILAIARGAGRPIHLQHISTDKEMAMLAAYKDIATVAVSPNHLFLRAPDCYEHFQNYSKLDPPIRGEENRIGLWKAVASGIVDILASGHRALDVESKERPYPDCVSGCPSVQTMIPLMLDQVTKGVLSLQSLIDLSSASPARIFNIAGKGRIATGYDADFTVIDLKKDWILEDDDVETGCGWDLCAGVEFSGKVTGTIIRGNRVMWDENIANTAKGKPARFYDTFEEYPQE